MTNNAVLLMCGWMLSIGAFAQTVTLPYNPDINQDSEIGTIDLLELLPLFDGEFVPSPVLIGDQTLTEYIEYLTAVSDSLSQDSLFLPLVPGNVEGEILIWDGTEWALLAPGEEGAVLMIENGVPSWGALSAGCTDSTACNFDEQATVSLNSLCVLPDSCGICGGTGSVYECGCFEIPEGDCDCEGHQLDALGTCGGPCSTDENGDGICDSVQGPVANSCTAIEHGGHVYDVFHTGNLCWFAENLRWMPEVHSVEDFSDAEPRYHVYEYQGNSFPEAVLDSNFLEYGILYNWLAANAEGTCPTGWHIPSDSEWTEMAEQWSPEELAAEVEWTSGDPVGLSPFQGVPGGLTAEGNSHFGGQQGYYWSSTPGYYPHRSVFLMSATSNFIESDYPVDMGIALRCVKELPCEPQTWYIDSDGDGLGEPTETVSSCNMPPGFAPENDDLCFDLMALNYAAPDNAACVYESNCVSEVDWQGYTYNVVSIAGRCWFQENLRSTVYLNGDTIPMSTWSGYFTSPPDYGAYRLPNDDGLGYLNTYGILYNGLAVLDPRSLCPSGWEIPTDMDFKHMEHHLGANWTELNQEPDWNNDIGLTENVGGQMKAPGTLEDGSGLWLAPNEGGNGLSGFRGVPAGFYSYGWTTPDDVVDIGVNGSWWTRTQYGSGMVIDHAVTHDLSGVKRVADQPAQWSFSVRCMQSPSNDAAAD